MTVAQITPGGARQVLEPRVAEPSRRRNHKQIMNAAVALEWTNATQRNATPNRCLATTARRERIYTRSMHDYLGEKDASKKARRCLGEALLRLITGDIAIECPVEPLSRRPEPSCGFCALVFANSSVGSVDQACYSSLFTLPLTNAFLSFSHGALRTWPF